MYRGYFRAINIFLLILVFAAIFVGRLNTYTYGTGDQVITVPFVKSFAKIAVYPHDYVVREKLYHYSILWVSIGFLAKYFNLQIPTLFFLLHWITVCLIFSGLFLIAKELFKKSEVAFLTLFFFLFTNSTLASEVILENQFLTRNASIPFILFGVYLFMRERYYLAFCALGLGFLIHPISSVCILIALVTRSIYKIKEVGRVRLLLCVGLLLIILSPLIIWTIKYHPNMSFSYAPPAWLDLLRWRSSHIIFPFSWEKSLFLRAGLSMIVFGASLKYAPQGRPHYVAMWIVATIFIFCIVGTIFSEFIPVAIVLKMQLLRCFKFFLFFVFMYFAHFFFRVMESDNNIFKKIIIAISAVGILWGAKDWIYGYITFIAYASIMIFLPAAYKKSAVLKISIMLITILALMPANGGGLFQKNQIFIGNAQEQNWLDVQYWAKQNTTANDIFVVPPDLMGFRVESERTVYCEFKDGTLTNFNPAFGYEWDRRMKMLGCNREASFCESFSKLMEKDFLNIAIENKEIFHRCFVVMYKERTPLYFPAVYKNNKFIIYEVKGLG